MNPCIHLDFLANFPLNKRANSLLQSNYPNPNTFDNDLMRDLSIESATLAKMFGKGLACAFDYSCGEFLSLFCTLSNFEYHINLAPSLSQQSFYAAKQFETMRPNAISYISLTKDGVIESAINDTKSHKNAAFFLPIINQDILCINPIQKLIDEILSIYPQGLIFCDISLCASLLHSFMDILLALSSHPQVIFVCNAEHIGLMRKNGFMLCHSPITLPALKSYFDTQLLRPSLFKAAYCALTDILAQQTVVDSKNVFFATLCHYAKDITLFSPLSLTPQNALALRFKHIKARLLIQSMQVDGIYTINGQDCLFGNAKPSFVLQTMGYEEAQCRELLSISYKEIDNIEAVASRIANAYLQLRQFNI